MPLASFGERIWPFPLWLMLPLPARLVFVASSTFSRPLAASVTPFILLELLILALLMLVPETVTWLPELLSRN